MSDVRSARAERGAAEEQGKDMGLVYADGFAEIPWHGVRRWATGHRCIARVGGVQLGRVLTLTSVCVTGAGITEILTSVCVTGAGITEIRGCFLHQGLKDITHVTPHIYGSRPCRSLPV
jgi:hypothetical protein